MNITLKIDDFEGPLDLLLHLIKENKMDLLNLKIEIIIDEYLDFIHKMEEMNLNIASSYLVMASELIEMKSKLLLPCSNDSSSLEEENMEENLVNRLIEYQKYKDMTGKFRELELERREIHTKLPEDLREYREGLNTNNIDVTLDDLIGAFNKFLERKKLEQPLNTKITKKEISVYERTVSIRRVLKEKKRVNFFELFEILNKSYVVATFLAVLEMAKENELRIIQENKFGEIICEVCYE